MSLQFNNLVCYKQTQLTDDTKLTFFVEQHSTKEGTWARLQLDAGEIDFIFLNGQGRELSRHRISENDPVIFIPPAALHKIEPISSKFNAALSFYCAPHRYFNKKYKLNNVHTDLLTMYNTYLQQQGPLNILDIGCGSGRNLLFLALAEHLVTGMDIKTEAIENIQHIAAQENLNHVKAMVHDLHQPLNLQQSVYDLIISTVSLQFLNPKRIPDLLEELIDATNAHGLHFIVFPIAADQFSMPESFTFLAKKNELYEFYQNQGWAILEYKETIGQLHKLDANGKPIQGKFGLLLTQKVR